MSSVAGTLTVKVDGLYTGDGGFYAGRARDVGEQLAMAIAAGTGANQCDLVGAFVLSLLSSTAQTVNLKSLSDPNGVVFTNLARVRLAIFWNTTTTAGAETTVGADATNGWTNGFNNNANGEGVPLRAGTAGGPGLIVLAAPDAIGLVVTASNRVIRFTPSAHAQTVRGIIWGCSA